MAVRQLTLEESVLPDADEVMARALERAWAEEVGMWSSSHYELIREEWEAAYPDADKNAWESQSHALGRTHDS